MSVCPYIVSAQLLQRLPTNFFQTLHEHQWGYWQELVWFSWISAHFWPSGGQKTCKNGPLWRFPHNSVKDYQPISFKLYMSINGGTGKNWCDFHEDLLIFGPLVAKKLVKRARIGAFRTNLSKVRKQYCFNFRLASIGVLARNDLNFMEIHSFLALCQYSPSLTRGDRGFVGCLRTALLGIS